MNQCPDQLSAPKPPKPLSSSQTPQHTYKAEDLNSSSQAMYPTDAEESLVTIVALPAYVMLRIFSFLCIPERIRISRVCKLWKMLVEDFSLWRHVDLTSMMVKAPVARHLFQRYLGSGLQSLSLGGYLISGLNGVKYTPVLIKEVGRRCPHLTRLEVHIAFLRTLPITKLPQSLRSLELHSCEISRTWLLEESDFSPLPFLQHLVLDCVPAFNDRQLKALSRLKALCSLELVGLPLVSDEGLMVALTEVNGLYNLKVVNCSFSADGLLQAVGQHLQKLQKLIISVKGLTTKGLSQLERMDSLQYLELNGPFTRKDFLSTTHILSVGLKMPRLHTFKLLESTPQTRGMSRPWLISGK
ncbi:F-box/LRR-repeat protein 12-like [Choloepus didactylus]|uniref:F-box/LRR-repeat protein 12-like n=1 Tax=Choloepus didactylus TaxID=27675 RepID=UPI00189D9DC8|nr:F-box/LRR-repeat protein 12-like [Choloepus didactylus]